METKPKRTVFIAVMGGTGSGKTTFINLASGSSLRVGEGLDSCTSVVQTAQPFELEDSVVTLVDTPGFDDTTKTDAEILQTIALYLSTAYEHDQLLSGIIYIHRITDYRVGGMSRRNFNLVRQICGDEHLKNMAVVTNMWNMVDLETGEAREAELRTNDLFFKPVLDRGATFHRHDNSQSSAHTILRQFLGRFPFPLQIQQELVDDQRELSDTAAGQELGREYAEQIKKHHEEIEELQREMEAAVLENDEQAQRELQRECNRLKEKALLSQRDADGLSSFYRKEKAKLEQALKEKRLQRETINQTESYPGPPRGYDLDVLRKQIVEQSASNNEQLKRQLDSLERQVEEKERLDQSPSILSTLVSFFIPGTYTKPSSSSGRNKRRGMY